MNHHLLLVSVALLCKIWLYVFISYNLKRRTIMGWSDNFITMGLWSGSGWRFAQVEKGESGVSHPRTHNVWIWSTRLGMGASEDWYKLTRMHKQLHCSFSVLNFGESSLYDNYWVLWRLLEDYAVCTWYLFIALNWTKGFVWGLCKQLGIEPGIVCPQTPRRQLLWKPVTK